MIPALRNLVGSLPLLLSLSTTSSSSSKNIIQGAEARARLQGAIRNLVRIICSPEYPIVFFLDDLQWADSGTFDLLSVLANDNSCRGLVLLGACRFDEVNYEHDLASFLRNLEMNEKKPVVITPIVIHDLTLAAVDKLIADRLNVPMGTVKILANAIYHKTKGNTLFVQQSLESLHKTGILRYNQGTRSWEWDAYELKTWAKGVNNVVDLLVHKIRRLSPNVQKVLTTASCLGAKFDRILLSKILPDLNVSRALDQATETGLVIEHHGIEENFYKFVHDKVQQAAYAHIPQDKQDEFHLDLCRELKKRLSKEDIDIYIFLIVDQMSRCKALLVDQDEKDELSLFCLQAGRKAVLCSDFKNGAYYFTFGISLLSERNWRDQFYLSLDLHNAAAEATCCTGEYNETDKHITEVLSHARLLKDKIQAYSTKIYSLGARRRLQEAMETGVSVLGELGETFPSKPTKMNILFNVVKTKLLLKGKTDTDLAKVPDMLDSGKIAAMSILNLIGPISWFLRHDMFPLVPCRMVQLSLRHGMSAISSFGLAMFGQVMSGLGRYEDAEMCMNLGLGILERYKVREWLPRVHVIVYGFHAHLTKPLNTTIEHLSHAIEVGIETGDFEFATIGTQIILSRFLFIGKPLLEMKKNISDRADFVASYKQEQMLVYTKISLQTVYNLLGLSRDPTVLTGEAMDEERTVAELRSKKHESGLATLHVYKIYLAYIMNQYEVASDIAGKTRLWTKRGNMFLFSQQCFYDGLSSLANAQEGACNQRKKRRKHLSTAKKAIKFMKKLARLCPGTYLHKVFLLEAEFAAAEGNLDDAIPMYQYSASMADREGFLHEKALACERAGLTLRHSGDSLRSATFLSQAIEAYSEWGACAKVVQMRARFPDQCSSTIGNIEETTTS